MSDELSVLIKEGCRHRYSISISQMLFNNICICMQTETEAWLCTRQEFMEIDCHCGHILNCQVTQKPLISFAEVRITDKAAQEQKRGAPKKEKNWLAHDTFNSPEPGRGYCSEIPEMTPPGPASGTWILE